MLEWKTGLVWLVAAIFAALAAPLVETQHARLIGLAPASRFTDVAPTELPVIAGWPPGTRMSVRTNTGPPAAFFLST